MLGGVKVSIAKISRGRSAIQPYGPIFECTIGVHLDHLIPELAEVKGLRIVLTEVKDDDGSLLKQTKFFFGHDRKFQTTQDVRAGSGGR